jgi:hypothetical protein
MQPMRTTPTITYSTNFTNAIDEIGISTRTPTAYSSSRPTATSLSYNATGMTGLTTNRAVAYISTSTHQLSAEL